MSDYKNLNSETTRTLKKTLGIPVKLCALINRYKRRKGYFQHMEELWRIPGMTRRYYDMICKKYTIWGQKAPLSLELEPFVWSSLARPGDSDSKSGTDSRSFPSLRAGWRRMRNKSPKPGTSGDNTKNYVVDSVHMAASYTSDHKGQSLVAVNMKKSPARNVVKAKGKDTCKHKAGKQDVLPFPKMALTSPEKLPEELGDQSRLLLPINVQQSPSGDRLCIIYNCSPQKNKRPNKKILSPGVKNKTKGSKPTTPCSSRSKSPSILKRPLADKPRSSKSQLEEPRSSPEPDKHVAFSVTEPQEAQGLTTTYKSVISETNQIDKSKHVYETKEILLETYLGPSAARPADEAVAGAVASGEKVRKWINSNSDFMKTPAVTGSRWTPVETSSDSRLPAEEICTKKTVTRECVTSGRHGSPRRHSRGREHVAKQRRVPPAIQSARHNRRPSPSRGSSRSSSSGKSQSSGQPVARKLLPEERGKLFAKDPQTHGEPSRGYRFHRKRFRREKSVEKTVRKYKLKEREESPEEESSLSCTVI